jgi:hypothetical protein
MNKGTINKGGNESRKEEENVGREERRKTKRNL